jgi:carboxypeptidase C (cathepsin A)
MALYKFARQPALVVFCWLATAVGVCEPAAAQSADMDFSIFKLLSTTSASLPSTDLAGMSGEGSQIAALSFLNSNVSAVQAAEPPVTKSAEMRIDGRAVRYVATAGTIPIRNGNGEIAADMFYVAYTVAAQPGAAPRPVTFAFNGGPGSSSSPLLLAAIGPLRVNLDLPQPAPVTQATAVTLSPNDATILDRTDLVFLDAVRP